MGAVCRSRSHSEYPVMLPLSSFFVATAPHDGSRLLVVVGEVSPQILASIANRHLHPPPPPPPPLSKRRLLQIKRFACSSVSLEAHKAVAWACTTDMHWNCQPWTLGSSGILIYHRSSVDALCGVLVLTIPFQPPTIPYSKRERHDWILGVLRGLGQMTLGLGSSVSPSSVSLPACA